MREVIIAGGGAGGADLAARLADQGDLRVTLVDRHPTHLWKPLFHQVAAGTLDSFQDELPYNALARRHGFRFTLGTVTGLDAGQRNLQVAAVNDHRGREVLPARRLEYDYLVLALGSALEDFGTPGVAEHAMTLESREDAEDLHNSLLATLGRTAYGAGTPARITIVGGGATGVELAAEICHAAEVARAYGLDLPGQGVEISLIERAPRLLPPLPDHIAENAARVLDRLGVRLIFGVGVAEVEATRVRLDDGRELPSDLTVWAAGVRGPAVARAFADLDISERDRIRVDEHLRARGQDRIFAIGDCAHNEGGKDGAVVPPRAQAARQQAEYLATALPALIGGRPQEPFRYEDMGSLVSLARYDALGRIIGPATGMSLSLSGLAAKAAYRMLYRAHQRALLGLPRTLAMMLSDWLRRTGSAKVKLH